MGLLGGGGSILAVPALTMLLHFAPKEAVVISLSMVAMAASAGALGSFYRGTLPLAAGLVVGLAATVGALLMFWRPVTDTAPAPRRSLPVLLLLGFPLGILTGLIGVGGGFLIVPALVIVARLPMREAAGASLVVMAMAAASGLAGGMIAHHLPQRRLQQAFAVTLVVLGSFVLIRS